MKLDTSSWPESAIQSEWVRILGVCGITLRRRMRRAGISGERGINGLFLSYTKEEICDAFSIEPIELVASSRKR